MKKVLIVAVALLFAVSCSKEGGSKGGGYVAKVGGSTITVEDMQAKIKLLPPAVAPLLKSPEGMARVVEEVTVKEMLYLEAKKRGLDADKELQQRVEGFKREILIRQLLEKELGKELEASGNITEQDIKAYYDSHKDELISRTHVTIGQIVVKAEGDAKTVYERLQKGEEFGKVAAEMSVDTATAKDGGKLGTFKKGELSPEIEATVFRLRKGEVGPPLKTKDGIHIIKLIEIKGTPVELEKAKGFIGQQLAVERQEKSLTTFLDKLKKEYKIEVNKESFPKLVTAFETPAAPPAQPPSEPKK